MRQAAAAFVLAIAALACVPASGLALAPGQLFGIQDQDDVAMFDDPRFSELKVQTVRYLIDYRALLHGGRDRDRADAVYESAVATNRMPLISLNTFHKSGPPSDRTYRRAIRALIRRYPGADFQANNEANHATQAYYRDPEAAARHARIADRECEIVGQPWCRTMVPLTVVLFQQVRSNDRWIGRFLKAYRKTPTVWGIHTYGDANRRSSAAFNAFLKTYPRGRVWITETAAWFQFAAPTWPRSPQRQANRVRFVFEHALRNPRRVRRLYWYEWRGVDDRAARWDSGLFDAAGRARPAYDQVLRYRFRTRWARSAP